MLTVTTVNVNGIRAAAKKGFTSWLARTDADVVCLQEVRAEQDQLPPELRELPGWHTSYAPAMAKGRAGVAIYSRHEPTRVQIGFGSAEFDTSGRYLELELADGLSVGSLYLPSGEVDTPRQEEKERFMAEFLPYLVSLRERAAAEHRAAIVCGDWNIAHQEIDLKNWKANRKSAGFLPEERAWMSNLFGEVGGYRDVVRDLHPNMHGPYSWWSYRGRAFDNDAGWRIDLLAATPNLAASAVKAYVERAASHAERWSDHAPVTAVFDWQPLG
ncbi:MAG: exodeoxyribonuclease III [Corynebacteriales bacterium]|nr:exodeoxyribonuclease III [Mycobacteriales bacterium]